MKKIYALFMTLCLVLSTTAAPLAGVAKKSYPLYQPEVVKAELALDAMHKAPAATQGLQYDAEAGELIRYYNETDQIAINADYLAQGNLYIDIMAADQSDYLSLLLFVKDTVEGAIIPEGIYPITSTPAYNTALASQGYSDTQGVIPCAYYPLVAQGGKLYISSPMYFMQSGNIVVEHVNGNPKITINAVNSNNVPMTIVYEVGGKSEKVEVKVPLQYDATAADGALDYTFAEGATATAKDNGFYGTYVVDAADASCELGLLFIYPEGTADAETTIPAGTYTISDSQAPGTVMASSGYSSKGLSYSFFINITAEGKIALPIYFLVEGTVEVTKVDGKLKVEVNGLNSNGVAVHVVYDATPAEDPVVELPAASVRAWAYDLALAVEGEQYTFSYKATTAAKATLIFTDAEGVELATKDLGLVEAGANTAVLAASELPEAAEINWAIKLEAGAIAEFTELTDASKGIYNFYLPQGVAVDNNPESATFGTIYVAAATDGKTDGGSDRADAQKRGIFIYDQELNELNPTSNVGIIPSNVTLGSTDRQAMKRLVINPATNEVAFAHNAAPMAVWAVAAENVGGEAKNLIEGLGFTNVNALCFDEKGTLYVMQSAGYPAPGSLYKVVNGVVDTIFANNTRFGNADLALVSDNRGGIWICQNRGQLDGFNQLTHVNAAGEIDFEVNSTTPNGFESKNTARGTIAYNPAEDILAMSIGTGSTIGASLFKVTYDETTGVPALTLIGSTPSMGKNVDGLAFDYAGDLYGLSANKERFYKFAMPTENNACTTPAASKYAIKLVEEYIVKATVNPAETGVITGLAEGGVYVKGAEATLTATAAEGYEFVNWTVADSVVSTEATYTFVVEANVELVANFKEKVKAIEVNVTDATATSGEWSIDLAGSWNDQALTIKLWQDNTQGFGSYAPNTETGYYILLGAKELTPTTEGVYADNGDGTFTFTCSATEGTTQYNITVTGTSGAQEVYYETYELTNLVVTDHETFLVLSASDMNIGLAVMLGVNMDRTLMDDSQILFGEEELPILSSEPVTVTFNEELQTEVYTARVVVEHMGQQLGLELIMYAGGATSEPIAVNVIGATAAVDEATDVLKITGDWDGIAFELRINAYDPAQTLYDAPQIAEFETEDVYATSSYVTVIKTGENIDVIGEFMSPMGDIYNVYVNAIFAAGPETGVDNIQVENTTVKVVEDGQVFIIRNGVKFNANGAVVK